MGQNYRVALQPEAAVTGGISVPTTSATLSSGFVSIDGSTLHAEVHGASPATSYVVSFCPNGFSSACNYFGNNSGFTTDSSGNGSVDVTTGTGNAQVFMVEPNFKRGSGYITGFVVQ